MDSPPPSIFGHALSSAAGDGAPAHLASDGLDPCLRETDSSPWL